MSIVNALISSIARYGGDITVTSNGSTVRGRAIVEPLRYRNKIYIGGEQRHLNTFLSVRPTLTSPRTTRS